MLNVAVDLGWLTKVPRIRKPKVRLISQDFSYLRIDEEIGRLLEVTLQDELIAGVRHGYRRAGPLPRDVCHTARTFTRSPSRE